MKSLGYSQDLMSSTNTRAVLQKLPDSLKEKWGERKIEKWLDSTERKLKRDKDLAKKYCAILED